MNKLYLKIDLGRTHNKNKNPIIEKAIKEFHKEHLRISQSEGPFSKTDLIVIVRNMNFRNSTIKESKTKETFKADETFSIGCMYRVLKKGY